MHCMDCKPISIFVSYISKITVCCFRKQNHGLRVERSTFHVVGNFKTLKSLDFRIDQPIKNKKINGKIQKKRPLFGPNVLIYDDQF